MKLFFKIFAVFIFIHFTLNAWWSSGHQIVAEIAYENLTAETKIKVDEIIKTFEQFYPEHCFFSEAATWADDVRAKGLNIFDTWHFTNIPYDPEGILTSEDKRVIAAQNSGSDVVWFIPKAVESLSNQSSSAFTKALMLNLLIHTVADIHQPFHCCSRYSKEHPDGDKGGNLFKIEGMDVKNIHQLWDGGAGAFPIISKDKEVAHYARSLTEQFSKEYFPEIRDLDVKNWSIESQQIAVNFGYQMPENTQPSDEYMHTAQKIASERVTLAGYRLALVLNKIFSSE